MMGDLSFQAPFQNSSRPSRVGDDGRSVIPGAVSERLDFPGFRECTDQNNNPLHLAMIC